MSRSAAVALLVPLLLSFGAPLAAQDDAPYPHALGEYRWGGLSFFTDQDLFDPWRNMDRNYTMGVGIMASGAWVSATPIAWLNRALLGFTQPDLDKALLTRHSLMLVGSAFTPDSLGASDPVMGDRPYGSIFGLSSTRLVVPIRTRTPIPGQPPGNLEYYPLAIRTEVLIGGLGLGVSRAVQTWIHEHNSSVVPQGWDNQISNGGEPTLLLRVQVERRLGACWKADENEELEAGCGHPAFYGRRWFEATTFAEAMAGYYTNLAGGLRMRVGSFRSEFWEFDGAPLNNISQAAGGGTLNARNRFEAFAFAGAGGRLVGYNALLQGQFSSNPYEISASDVERLIGEFQVGAAVSIPLGDTWRWGLGYLYAGRSREFDGLLARAHTWGSAFVTFTKLPKI